MTRLKVLFSSLVICSLLSSCNNQVSDNSPQQTNDSVTAFQNQSIPYHEKISPSVLKIINTADEPRSPDNTEIKQEDIGPEYVDHFKFFSSIDKTGSGVEEVLAHDGYTNANKSRQ